jgi:hypothetical protein
MPTSCKKRSSAMPSFPSWNRASQGDRAESARKMLRAGSLARRGHGSIAFFFPAAPISRHGALSLQLPRRLSWPLPSSICNHLSSSMPATDLAAGHAASPALVRQPGSSASPPAKREELAAEQAARPHHSQSRTGLAVWRRILSSGDSSRRRKLRRRQQLLSRQRRNPSSKFTGPDCFYVFYIGT